MALISKFEERPNDGTRIHGEVLCGFRTFAAGDRTILQLDTYGSADREIPGKVSQSIQIDEAAARQLKRILERAFPGI